MWPQLVVAILIFSSEKWGPVPVKLGTRWAGLLLTMIDQDIYSALKEACPAGSCYPGEDYDYLVELDGVVHKIIYDKSFPKRVFACTWMWAQREGKPWQGVLEEIVRRSVEAKCYAVGL